MAGFRKASGEQAALKLGIYGPPGSGKTVLALMISEGLAKLSGKRVAFVDTERGTDFYTKKVEERLWHPEPFDFDALYTKSLTEMSAAVKALKPSQYSAICIDSMTHVWEACRAAYAGNTNKAGAIPLHAWGKIKAPYKDLMSFLLSSPMHVILCGRQGAEYEKDEETGELSCVGWKMKAEGETAYEPHILIRLEAKGGKDFTPTAFVEKDRTGVLAGKTIAWPNFDRVAKPLLPLLGRTQAVVETEQQAGARDAEELQRQETEREGTSKQLLSQWKARITLAATGEELDKLNKELTPEIKTKMLADDLRELRQFYIDNRNRFANKLQDALAVA